MAEISEDKLEPGEIDESMLEPEGGAEGGSGGSTSKPFVEPERRPYGSPIDAAKSLADTAMVGAGPQIEGGMAMIAQDAKNLLAGEPLHPKTTPAEAYKAVRDMGEAEHAKSDDTWWGKAGSMLGLFATPVPGKALPKGAGILEHANKGLKAGAGIGAVHGAVNSDADLASDDAGWRRYAELLKDTAVGGLGGAVTGAGAGGVLGAIEKPARSVSRRLPMDVLGVGEPARRSMQRQGIYDAAGDDLLALMKPGRGGMRTGSLIEDAVAEAQKRGQAQGDTVAAIDAAAPGGAVATGGMSETIKGRAEPFRGGSVQDRQVAGRMDREASNLLDSLGSTDPEIGARIPLAEAEAFKQRFGPAVGKQLRHAGEPAAKTDALAETYRALKEANEAGAQAVDPALAQKFIEAKKAFQRLKAPLEGAKVERSGLDASDFDWGDALAQPPPAANALTKAIESVPVLGPALTGGLNLAGQTYGRGMAANLAELIANGAANRTGGGVAGQFGAAGASMALDKLAPWSKFLDEERE